jgi:hypothetical protein
MNLCLSYQQHNLPVRSTNHTWISRRNSVDQRRLGRPSKTIRRGRNRSVKAYLVTDDDDDDDDDDEQRKHTLQKNWVLNHCYQSTYNYHVLIQCCLGHISLVYWSSQYRRRSLLLAHVDTARKLSECKKTAYVICSWMPIQKLPTDFRYFVWSLFYVPFAYFGLHTQNST